MPWSELRSMRRGSLIQSLGHVAMIVSFMMVLFGQRWISQGDVAILGMFQLSGAEG